MEYTKDPAKMIIFFDDSKEVVYGEIVFNNWNEPDEFVTDKGVTFTIVESQEIFEDEYDCKVTMDKENLNKLRKLYPKLYEKIKTYVTEKFYSMIADEIMNTLKEEYGSILSDKEIEKLINDWIDLEDVMGTEFIEKYSNIELDEMLSYVLLVVTIVRSE